MKFLYSVSFVLVIALICSVSSETHTLPGQPISDQVASSIRGGSCSGVVVPYCVIIDPETDLCPTMALNAFGEGDSSLSGFVEICGGEYSCVATFPDNEEPCMEELVHLGRPESTASRRTASVGGIRGSGDLVTPL